MKIALAIIVAMVLLLGSAVAYSVESNAEAPPHTFAVFAIPG